jgi:ribonuclease P protein component
MRSGQFALEEMENPKGIRRFSLPRGERLRGETTVSRLFASGESGFCYPVRYVFLRRDASGAKRGCGATGVRVLFSVPKKNFKKAVARNLLKRRMKEVYRLNKNILPVTCSDHAPDIAFVYSSKEATDYKTIEKGVKRALAQIGKQLCDAQKDERLNGISET